MSSGEQNGIEFYLENLYSKMYGNYGFSQDQIREVIDDCKKESKKKGTDDLPDLFGDLLINEAHRGAGRNVVKKAKLGGASDDEIRAWWNLHDLERRMIKWEDDLHRLTVFKSLVDSGTSEDDAIQRIRKSFPIYGDPTDESQMKGIDRPLPEELHLAINKLLPEINPQNLKNEIDQFSSMNALLRHYLKR